MTSSTFQKKEESKLATRHKTDLNSNPGSAPYQLGGFGQQNFIS